MRRKAFTDDVIAVPQPTLDGVPAAVADAFFRGLDDVRHGRTVSVASAVAEGRRRIAEYREHPHKTSVDDPAGRKRK